MCALSPQPDEKSSVLAAQDKPIDYVHSSDDGIDLRDTLLKLGRNLDQILGLTCFGLLLGAILYLVVSPFLPVQTTARISFSFPGYERGEYPDRSKFQADDLRAPEIISEALKRLRQASIEDQQSKIRAAITVEGMIPVEAVRERDRLRAAGQPVPPYIPDEFAITLSLPRNFPLGFRQREQLLAEIQNVYKENFRRTYIELPLSFGNAFGSLKGADYFEYELILREDVRNMITYLEQQANHFKTFRARSTNLSFSDLLTQAQLFTQIRLNEALGLIEINGLSMNRKTAMVKMNYYLTTLQDRERVAVEEDSVVNELLQKAQERAQNYVLGVKAEASQPKSNAPILDQGLIDSLIANDGYTFLLHKALDSGLRLKAIQSEIAQLLRRHKIMETFQNENAVDQADIIASVEKSLSLTREAYTQLLNGIRSTYFDFTNQQFADAIRFTNQVRTERIYRPLLTSAGIGALLGLFLGAGMSLLDLKTSFSKGITSRSKGHA